MINTSASFSYVVSRQIFTISLEGDIVAFKDVTKMEGKSDFIMEGISTLEKIAKVTMDKPVQGLDRVCMFREGVVEAHAKDNLFHYNEWYDKFNIENPFSYVEEFGLTGFHLLNSEWASHNFYRLNGERLPHPIYFSDSSGLMVSSHFDLLKIVEKLRDWKDIIWTLSKRNDSFLHATHCGWGLEFRYLPNGEVWENIKDIKDSFMVREYLKREVFRIMEFAVDEEAD
jgi:hypothetical protein